MIKTPEIPLFAVVGHPNEGKSSVLSTLTEDDSVVVSPYPGETVNCQRFPFRSGGQTLIEFVDTPGFQNPKRSLQWMQASGLTDVELMSSFLDHHLADKAYHHDCELLKPLKEGAGVIYVVDASRPLLPEDEAEMEILRLVNRPRLAILNVKAKETTFLENWKDALRRHFNVIRVFNAHHARYPERIALLNALALIQQDWEPNLNRAVEIIQENWSYRQLSVAEHMVHALEQALELKVERRFSRASDADHYQKEALNQYKRKLVDIEKNVFREIRGLYRHHLYDFQIGEESILQKGLFSEKTWQLMGLTQSQLLWTAAGTGAGLGAALDIAASGLTFGIFSATGAAVGAGSVWMKGKDLARIKVQGIPLGGSKIIVGPQRNPQFPFILLDRMLLYFKEMIRHTHGNRSQSASSIKAEGTRISLFEQMDSGKLKVLRQCLDRARKHRAYGDLHDEIHRWVRQIANESES